MSAPKRHPLSRALISAAAVFDRPLASVARAPAAVLSFVRGSRKPFIESSRSAALKLVDTRKWTPLLLKQLEWRRFEELCAAYFELLGFRTRVTRSASGAGVDIHLLAEDAERTAIVVQSKAWDAYRIGTKGVRELKNAMVMAKASQGVLVTSGRFTQEAVALAGSENIELIDGADFLAKIGALAPEQAQALLKFATQGDFLTPTCPSCSLKMISRKSTREGRNFWGCRNYPGCKHTFSAGTPA